MPAPDTRLRAQHLTDRLPPLPPAMRGKAGRERARHAFITRTLTTLRTDRSITGDRAEDWRRVASELAMLGQMAAPGDNFQVTVLELEALARQTAGLEPALAGLPSGTGPQGGDLIFPWQAHEDDWISVPGGPAGPFVSTAMAMPNQAGIARTVVMVSQRHRYHAGSSHADVHIKDGTRVERLDAEVERARAREQWNEDHSAWHNR
ncbi:hypothetical protein [Streptomyces sp. AVP053U2]|uniref:hypothetical protein n=1 Tax=Streptomyces sp. AVP053U2 TaxID=1737066 RepID=UPI00073BD58E|nr:hypothetical protein [Streptomyces sp. AVP053U2]ODA70305.1 hypothetical protein APS67_005532 [Streptomyces sp. AVP053U2]